MARKALAIAAGFALGILTLLAIAPTLAPAAAQVRLNGALVYVANDDGSISAYQVGSWQRVARWTGLPITDGVRGVAYRHGYLYIAHGGDGAGGTGGMLKWDVATAQTVYNRSYPFGIDQPAVCKRGGTVRVYMPTGELSASRVWQVLGARTGNVIRTIDGGFGPHNTICHQGDVLMGGRRARFLHQTNGPSVGPTPSAAKGVRPFVVNASNTLAYITWTRFRGFSVGNLRTGRIIATRSFGAVPPSFRPSAPSHGISLSPDGRQLYVLDMPTHEVRVYSAGRSPRYLAAIPIGDGLRGSESPCAYDCARDGWLLHSMQGAYVFVGDSGDVISTRTRRVVAFLPALENTRHGFLEIIWRNGRPVTSTGHFGVGR